MRNAYISCPDIDNCLLKLKTDRKLAVAVDREHAKNTPVQITDTEMYCFSKSENIFTYSVVMMMVKDFHLRAKINNLIRQISESGLLPKWQKESEIIRMLEIDGSADGTIKLKVEHVAGAFILIFVGWALASLMYGFEWFVYWLSRKKYRIGQKLEKSICFA